MSPERDGTWNSTTTPSKNPRQHHPAWRLLRSDHASLIASFLHRAFIAPNERVLAQSDLAEALEDALFALRERLGPEAFPRPALDYLNDWASPERGWLRKFYRHDSDEPQFDLTPATEKAVAWLVSLTERSFVGTESRLLTLFDLLRQICEGTETDPEARAADLRRRRDALDAEIERVRTGDLPLLDDTALKDRFQQFMQTARDLLTDFREVEQNFRSLGRQVRERITLWEGSRGALLEDIMTERDAIGDSDPGADFAEAVRRYETATGRTLPRAASLPSCGVVEWRRAERRDEVAVSLVGRFLGWLASTSCGRSDAGDWRAEERLLAELGMARETARIESPRMLLDAELRVLELARVHVVGPGAGV